MDEGIKYLPVVWSAFGRPHAETTKIIRQLAKRTARRRGLLNASVLERRICAKIGTEIWRRAARMVMACLPHISDEEARDGDAFTDLGKAEPPHAVEA